MVNRFNGKYVPDIQQGTFGLETQQDYCDVAICDDGVDSAGDCGECLFDDKRCPYSIFEQWKQLNNKNNE